MSLPSTVADPQVVGLSQLLEDIRQGFVLVPRFQRPLIWSVDQQIELLSSIRDGVPIGSILVWRTRTHDLACYDRIGRHRVEARGSGPGGVRQYVLDGFQRLSTLYSALYQEDATADSDDVAPRFFLDLDSKEFIPSDAEPGNKRLLPISILLNRMELLRRERKFEKDVWVENAEEVFGAFDRYRIPVIPLVTEDFRMATRAFERINRMGTQVSRLHVVHALSWSDQFDLLERVKALRDEHLAPLGWGGLDDDVLLETCALSLGLPVYETSAESIAEKLRAAPQALEQAVVSLTTAATFLRGQGLYSPEIMPYSRQAVLLAAALHPASLWPDNVATVLSAWLWLTTYSELFAGISGGRLQRVHEGLQRTMNTGRLEWPGWKPFSRRPLPARYDFRSARGKALALRLAELNPLLPDGSAIQIQWTSGADYLRDSMVQIVPRTRVSAASFASAGNRFLVPPEHSAAFRSALLTISAHMPNDSIVQARAWLQSHAVSDEALADLATGNLETFIRQREADLNALEEEFVERHRAVLRAGNVDSLTD
ncbi:MAG TPA: DUF262 domain-containing protein [Polyangiaceae bacterium]|jgi:hypothetical protein|nr:DUF262 domain-containing protein [Polyangiaceae bacterium]